MSTRADIEAKCVDDGGQLLRQGRAARDAVVRSWRVAEGSLHSSTMKILVPTKRVPDTDQKIVAAADGSRSPSITFRM